MNSNTVIRFVVTSAKFGICTVVGLIGTFVEALELNLCSSLRLGFNLKFRILDDQKVGTAT